MGEIKVLDRVEVDTMVTMCRVIPCEAEFREGKGI